MPGKHEHGHECHNITVYHPCVGVSLTFREYSRNKTERRLGAFIFAMGDKTTDLCSQFPFDSVTCLPIELRTARMVGSKTAVTSTSRKSGTTCKAVEGLLFYVVQNSAPAPSFCGAISEGAGVLSH